MGREHFNKLIRDKIPERIKNDDADPEVRKLDSEEYRTALAEKLFEEAEELREAMQDEDREEVIDELCDVLQLIESIGRDFDIDMQEVKAQKEQKAKERGEFEKRQYLEYIDE